MLIFFIYNVSVYASLTNLMHVEGIHKRYIKYSLNNVPNVMTSCSLKKTAISYNQMGIDKW